jgi:membrane peptidoglycan carboxypeptidase
VKVLEKMGVSNMIEMGRKMGITSWRDPNQYGLSLTLGGGEVTLLELANVYATIANSGAKPTLHGIARITGRNGDILYEHKAVNTPAIDSRVAFMLTDILKDNSARAPAFGSHSSLVIPGHPEVAVKTGTSNNLKDNLTVGYSQDYLVAVWVGNNDSSPMSRIASGITGASPIWNSIMSSLLSGKESLAWDTPAGVVSRDACGKKEWFLSENDNIRCPAPRFRKDELARQSEE